MSEAPPIKKRRQKVVRIFIWIVAIFIVSIISIDIYCETAGVPKGAVVWLQKKLEKQGVRAEFERVRAGFIGGVKIDTITVNDFIVTERKLVAADQMNLEFDRRSLLRLKPIVKTMTIIGGNSELDIALLDPDSEDKLRLTDLTATFVVAAEEFYVDSFTAKLGAVAVTATGKIQRPAEARPVEHLNITLETLLEKLTAGQKHSWAELIGFCNSRRAKSDAQLDIRFDIPLDDAGSSQVSVDLAMVDFTYRGLSIDNVEMGCQLEDDVIKITWLNVTVDENEHIEGTLQLDLQQQQISGELSYAAVPHGIVEKLQPQLMKQLQHIDFQTRPHGTVILHPSPVRQTEAWHLDVTMAAAEALLYKAKIHDAKIEATINEQVMTVHSLAMGLGDHASVKLHGELYLDSNELITHVVYTGDPRDAAPLYLQPKMRADFLKAWKDCEWRDTTQQSFTFDMHRYSESDGRPAVWIQGNGAIRDFLYKDFPVDEAAGNFYLDAYNRVSVSEDIQIRCGDHTGSLSLAYELAEGAKLVRYDGESRLPADVMMGMIRRDWQWLPEQWGLRFVTPPHVTMRGWANLTDRDEYQSAVRIRAKDHYYYLAEINESDTKVHFLDQRRYISTEIDSAIFAGGEIREFAADMAFTETDTHLTGTIAGAGDSATAIGRTAFRARINTGNNGDTTARPLARIEARTEVMNHHDWQLTEVQCSSTIEHDQVHSVATVDRVRNGPLGLDQVTTEFEVTEDGVTIKQLDVALIVADDQVTVDDVSCSGGLDDNKRLQLRGTMATMVYNSPSEFAIEAGSFQLDWQRQKQKVKVTAEHATIDRENIVRNADIEVEFGQDQRSTGHASCDSITWNNGITAKGARINFTVDGDEISHNSTWADVDVGGWRLTKAETTGTLQPHNRFKLKAARVQYNDVVLENMTARVEITDTAVAVNDMIAGLYDGTLIGDTRYDWRTVSGTTDLKILNADYGKFIGTMETADLQGRLDGNANLKLNFIENELRLEGDGEFTVEGGDFWQVPIISDFLNFLDMFPLVEASNLAEITRLHSTLDFQGDRVYMPDLESNGTIVAINAKGYYIWGTKTLDYRIKATPLRPLHIWRRFILKLPLVPKVMDLLNSRVSGPVDDPKWEILENLFNLKPLRRLEQAQPKWE